MPIGDNIGGGDLKAMFSEAARLLSANVDPVNALNVFPVPDGDTGTNMHLTMEAVVEAAGQVGSDSAGEVASAMARGALMGARATAASSFPNSSRALAPAWERLPRWTGIGWPPPWRRAANRPTRPWVSRSKVRC